MKYVSSDLYKIHQQIWFICSIVCILMFKNIKYIYMYIKYTYMLYVHIPIYMYICMYNNPMKCN